VEKSEVLLCNFFSISCGYLLSRNALDPRPWSDIDIDEQIIAFDEGEEKSQNSATIALTS
jgi:hypothetical protein